MKNIIITLLLLHFAPLSAQWTRIENLPASDFTALQTIDATIYAASGNTLYFSSDAGQTWQSAVFTTTTTEARAIAKFSNRLYLGTSTGIYSASVANLNEPWIHHVNSGWVSSFAQRGNALYASTIGGGIYRRNNNGNWVNASSGLPSYSLSVYQLLDTPEGLTAFAGSNGTFYRLLDESNFWHEHYYNGQGYDPGLDFEDALRVGNTLYVSRYNKVLRSDNFGDDWVQDQTGLSNGINRTMAVGLSDLYVLTTSATDAGSLTFLNKRGILNPGTNWGTGMHTLEFFSYALAELGQKTFIASNQGVYVNDGALEVAEPMHVAPQMIIYPNPSPDGLFTIKGPTQQIELTVYDVTGKALFKRENVISGESFTVPGRGLYLVKAVCGTDIQILKVIAQ